MKDFRDFIQQEEEKYTGIKPDGTDLIRISDANHYFNKYQAEQLILSVVSQQRELLLAYEIYNASEDDKKNNMKYLENLVDTYLANNCG